MKKLISIVLALTLILSLAAMATSCTQEKKYVIGISQLVTHDALDAATQGFMDAVKAGLGEENVEFDLQDADNSTDACATIANNFVSKKVDLIMANATSTVFRFSAPRLPNTALRSTSRTSAVRLAATYRVPATLLLSISRRR